MQSDSGAHRPKGAVVKQRNTVAVQVKACRLSVEKAGDKAAAAKQKSIPKMV